VPTIATTLAEQIPGMGGPQKMVLALSGLMIMVGLAFKLSAFPFHFWCPDVFEGASAEIGAFLSVASKAAALVLLVRVALGIGMPTNRPSTPPDAQVVAEIADTKTNEGTSVLVRLEQEGSGAADRDATASDGAATVRWFSALVLAFFAAVTCTFGNLAAYGQTNMKRLLAYSTIAHAGYMMLAVPAALVLASDHPAGAVRAVASLGIYLGVYLFMNLVAFSIVAFLRDALGSEEIADYAGLIHHSPVLVVCMATAMFSLVGIPPLAGFIGKFAVFASLAEGYQLSGAFFLLVLLVVGGLNTAISLFYYLRVVKVMSIDPQPERARRLDWSLVSLSGAYLVAVTIPLVLLFISWSTLNDWAVNAAAQLF
jgi:NADH-quinone oxidoreductase subunit N